MFFFSRKAGFLINSQLDEKELKNSIEAAKGVPRKPECCIEA